MNQCNKVKEIFSFKNHAANEAGGLVPDHFLFIKASYGAKAIDLELGFKMFR